MRVEQVRETVPAQVNQGRGHPEGTLAQFAASLTPSGLPDTVRNKTHELILDLIGVALLGSTTGQARRVFAVARDLGGVPRATAIGYSTRLDCVNAALVNGTSGHSTELDDAHRHCYFHPGTVVIPAALAIAEAEGSSGRDLVCAVAAGYEVSIRVALALNPAHRLRGFHTTGTCGPLGAAAAAGHLLRLNKEQMLHALALAATQGAGLWQTVSEGSEGKRFHAGRASAAGVLAALLARGGVTGAREFLSGRFGMGNVLAEGWDHSPLTLDLGQRWDLLGVGIKPYASCRFTHTPVEAALRLRESARIRAGEVASVEVRMSEMGVDQLGDPRPATLMAAQLSAPFSVALSLLYGRAGYSDFVRGLGDPEVRALAERVDMLIDSSLEQTSRTSTVRIRTRDGEIHSMSVALARGEPEFALSREELRMKFLDLASQALTSTQADVLLDLLEHLDSHESLHELWQRLAG